MKLPPFGEGRVAARLDEQLRRASEAADNYAMFRAFAVRKFLLENHDPGDEDRSER